MELIKVEGNPGLARDVNSLAIINTDKTEYENYIKQRDMLQEQKLQAYTQAEEIASLKQDFAEIKQLLLSIINK